MDNRKKRLLGMGFVVAVLFAASMLAFQMQKAAPAAAPAVEENTAALPVK